MGMEISVPNNSLHSWTGMMWAVRGTSEVELVESD